MAGFKVKKSQKKTGSDIDFEYIANQVDTGLQVATICGIVDLGEQDGGWYFDDKGETFFATEDEAQEFIEFIEQEPSLGERLVEEHDLAEVEEEEEVWKLPFKIVKKSYVFVGDDNITYFTNKRKAEAALKQAIGLLEEKLNNPKTSKGAKKYVKQDLELLNGLDLEPTVDAVRVACSIKKMEDSRQCAAWVEIPSNRVEYIEGDEDSVRQYRIPLNPVFKGHVNGFKLVVDDDGVLTPKALRELIVACGCDEVLDEDSNSLGDISLLAGKSFQTTVNQKDTFFSVKGRLPLAEGTEVEPLDNDPIVVTFDDDPEDIVAAFKGFYLQSAYKEVIKKAKNFSGSNMEKALAILEGDTDDSDNDDGTEPSQEAAEQPKKTTPKKGASKKTNPADEAPVDAESDSESGDDESPF